LPAKNCKHAFEFVAVIIQNVVSFFHLGNNKNKNDIFNDVMITLALHKL